MIYALTYDLNATGQDYDSLYKKINSLGETLRPLQNLWLLNSQYSADTIRDEIRSVIDDNDFVFIARLTKGSYSAWMPVTAHAWLEARL